MPKDALPDDSYRFFVAARRSVAQGSEVIGWLAAGLALGISFACSPIPLV